MEFTFCPSSSSKNTPGPILPHLNAAPEHHPSSNSTFSIIDTIRVKLFVRNGSSEVEPRGNPRNPKNPESQDICINMHILLYKSTEFLPHTAPRPTSLQHSSSSLLHTQSLVLLCIPLSHSFHLSK